MDKLKDNTGWVHSLAPADPNFKHSIKSLLIQTHSVFYSLIPFYNPVFIPPLSFQSFSFDFVGGLWPGICLDMKWRNSHGASPMPAVSQPQCPRPGLSPWMFTLIGVLCCQWPNLDAGLQEKPTPAWLSKHPLFSPMLLLPPSGLIRVCSSCSSPTDFSVLLSHCSGAPAPARAQQRL